MTLKDLVRTFRIGQRFDVYSREQNYGGCIMNLQTLNGVMIERLGHLQVKGILTIENLNNVIIIDLG